MSEVTNTQNITELQARRLVDDWITDGDDWRLVYRSKHDGMYHAIQISDRGLALSIAVAPDYQTIALKLGLLDERSRSD